MKLLKSIWRHFELKQKQITAATWRQNIIGKIVNFKFPASLRKLTFQEKALQKLRAHFQLIQNHPLGSLLFSSHYFFDPPKPERDLGLPPFVSLCCNEIRRRKMTKTVSPDAISFILANPCPDSSSDLPEIIVQVLDLKPAGNKYMYDFFFYCFFFCYMNKYSPCSDLMEDLNWVYGLRSAS